eukprot:6468820-Amphidinium_carterae.2
MKVSGESLPPIDSAKSAVSDLLSGFGAMGKTCRQDTVIQLETLYLTRAQDILEHATSSNIQCKTTSDCAFRSDLVLFG